MSDTLESKFLNKNGVINTLKIDVDNNYYTVEDRQVKLLQLTLMELGMVIHHM